jgi:hypothetical protein
LFVSNIFEIVVVVLLVESHLPEFRNLGLGSMSMFPSSCWSLVEVVLLYVLIRWL